MIRHVPASALLATALLLCSCRSVTAPSSQAPEDIATFRPALQTWDEAAFGRVRSERLRDSELSDPESRQVPVAYRLEAVADARGLRFTMFLRPQSRWHRPFYGPRTPGGWQFQAFLNVDQDPLTGYAEGFEFLTRDTEDEVGTLVLRRTEGGGGPGGWGAEVARIPVRVTSRLVTFTVPLDVIGDDGIVNFGVDLYATVLGGEDGATPVAHLVRYYSGFSRLRSRGGPETADILAEGQGH